MEPYPWYLLVDVMRKIYESNAIKRDDDHFTPHHRESKPFKPKAFRWIPSSTIASWLLPRRFLLTGISLSISTPQEIYEAGASIPFTVEMKNSFPFQVTIPTLSPLLWQWYVDGYEAASQVAVEMPPDETGTLVFNRGERKVFKKRWNGRFRVTNRKWSEPATGTHTIAAAINIQDPRRHNLMAETSIRID